MRHKSLRLRPVIAIFATAALLTCSVAACGGDDDSGGSGGSSAGAAATDEAAAPDGSGAADGTGGGGGGASASNGNGSSDLGDGTQRSEGATAGEASAVDTRRAAAALRGVYRALRTADVGAVCDAMTKAAQREVATAVHKDKGATCEKSLGRYFAFAERDGGLKPTFQARVLSAKVNGNRAVVTVRFPTTGKLRRVRLIKDGNTWKLPAMQL